MTTVGFRFCDGNGGRLDILQRWASSPVISATVGLLSSRNGGRSFLWFRQRWAYSSSPATVVVLSCGLGNGGLIPVLSQRWSFFLWFGQRWAFFQSCGTVRSRFPGNGALPVLVPSGLPVLALATVDLPCVLLDMISDSGNGIFPRASWGSNFLGTLTLYEGHQRWTCTSAQCW